MLLFVPYCKCELLVNYPFKNSINDSFRKSEEAMEQIVIKLILCCFYVLNGDVNLLFPANMTTLTVL